jgi:large subunit ribosomal protein L7/L12
MTEKIENILDQIKGLTLLEANELVTKLEEVFDIDVRSVGAVAVAAPAAGGAAGGDAVEEKTEFDVVLESVDASSKIAVLKVVRNITGLGLKEAKELVESVPKQIQEGLAKENAETIKKQLEEVGGKVSLT